MGEVTPGPIRVLLAEDQDMVRGALAALLSLEPDIEIVAEVARGDAVSRAVREYRPDIVLMDIEMPGMDGIEATAAVKAESPQTRVLILTTFGRPGYLRRAMESGASGFMLKDAPARDLALAVRRVIAGERIIDPQLAAQALSDGAGPLTGREREVLVAAAGGSGIADIAAVLHLSEGTVRNHLSSVIQKLEVRNRFEAVRLAQDKGWL